MVNSRQTIPMGLLISRAIQENSIKNDLKSNTEHSCNKVLESIKNPNIDHESYIEEFFKECEFVNSENKIHECVSILIAVSESDKETSPKFITNLGNTLVNKIIPNTVNYDKARQDIKKLTESSDDTLKKIGDDANDKIDKFEEMSRVINNHNKISSRFTLDVAVECTFGDMESVCETVCESVDTYDMPIHKKLNIALEEAMYLYEKNGIGEYNKRKLVSNILEYFLANKEVITDKEYNNMQKVLETNKFLTDYDLNDVNYFFNEKFTFGNKVGALSAKVDRKYKDLMKDISECKSVKGVGVVVARAFDLIFSTFVVTGTVSFLTVGLVISSLFSLVLIVGASPLVIVKCIKDELAEFKKRTDKCNPEEKERAKKVINYTEKKINSGDIVKESATCIDQACIDNDISPSVMAIHEPENDDEYAFNMIKDIVKESKDFADSEDVKDIINKYKADQNKDASKMKKMITKIYTKSPAAIIDHLPSIFEVIRVLGILVVTAKISVLIGIVSFIADRFIQMKIRRDESEKVLKHFKKEKSKVEAKINKMSDGPKKERMEEYLEAIDKSYDEIKDYHDNLRTDEENETLEDFLDEVTNVSMMKKFPIDVYFTTRHCDVVKSTKRAANLIKSEVIGKAMNGVEVEDNPFVDELENVTKDAFIRNYVTYEGVICIPICMIIGTSMETAIDICTDANKYLQSDCLLTCTHIDEKIFVLLYFNTPLDIEYSEFKDKTLTYEGMTNMSHLLAIQEASDEMINELNADTIVSELCKNVDSLYRDDIKSVSNLLVNSQLECSDFINSLKDIRFDCTDYSQCQDLDYCINILEQERGNNNITYSGVMVQLESVRVLRSILEAEKIESKKDPKDKEKAVEKVKNNISEKAKKVTKIAGNVANKTKDGKVAITANIKLAVEAMKKKVQGLGTKEKEISQSIDAAASGFSKGIEKALTTDRREAIIKGSIIPSFSKMIKTGIVGAGLYIVNPVLAAISAIGGLAVSKSLNKKERQMLLDEIDVELQVVESEIDKCKGEDPARYKQLLMYQRKLQRESQRIRYNVKLYAKDKSSLIDPEY